MCKKRGDVPLAEKLNQRARVIARGKERRLMREDIAGTPGCVQQADVGDARGDG